jgi:pyridoxine 5-phosphate synthase
MAVLCVNVDHVATLREARRIAEPDPVSAALIAELAGAAGITIHLREDRRHIQERDVRLMRETVKTKLNLEMAATDEMVKFALQYRPDLATLVPEKREEVTTEGGLDVAGRVDAIRRVVDTLQGATIPVSLFIDPDPNQVEAAHKTRARFIELHTGRYVEAKADENRQRELEALVVQTRRARSMGLRVNAGHGLNYKNVVPVAAIDGIEELNIGHSIIGYAVFVGMERAVREMVDLIARASRT